MAKALAFIQNNTSQTITGGGVVNPGTAQHGFGCTNGQYTIQVNGSNVNLKSCGYYQDIIAATVSATAAGEVTLSAYQDGALIASGSETIAAANDPASISFPADFKVNCSSAITLVASATAGDPIVTSVTQSIIKV